VTLAEITYDLQAPIGLAQHRALAGLANTYGVRRYRVDDERQQITVEYDASRLRPIDVENLLQQARIPAVQRA
jgi:hypothetical protein